MNVEEFDELINTIPKVESDNPISAMDSINVEDLRNAVERFKKIPTYQDLLKENQELKKQLEEMDSKLFFTKNELEMRQKTIDNKLRQQKEFIEWLERRLFLLQDEASELALGMCSTNYQDTKIEVYKEVLSKYKGIIGVEEEDELNG